MCPIQKKKSWFSAVMFSTLLVSQAIPIHAISIDMKKEDIPGFTQSYPSLKAGAIVLFCMLFYINFKDTFGTDVKTDIYRWVNKLKGDKSFFHALWDNLFKRAQLYKGTKVKTTKNNDLICSEFKPAQGAGIPLLFLDVVIKTVNDSLKYFTSLVSLALLLQTGNPILVASINK